MRYDYAHHTIPAPYRPNVRKPPISLFRLVAYLVGGFYLGLTWYLIYRLIRSLLA